MDFGILLVLATFIFIVYLTSRMDQKLAEKYKPEELKEKFCPPHKWRYEDQPGMEDISFIRCQLCKKTPQEINEGR